MFGSLRAAWLRVKGLNVNNLKPNAISELNFEMRDVEVFKIPDIKTRIATVQNYFFPRLEILLRSTLELIQEVYGVNPYERMTFVYRPSNRKTARQSYDFDMVHIGLSGKRRTDRPLVIKRADGKPFSFHPTYLTYNIDLEGSIWVGLLLFRQNVDVKFMSTVSRQISPHLKALAPVLSMNHITYSNAWEFHSLEESFSPQEIQRLVLYSSTCYFPVSMERGLIELRRAFVSLYPLLDSAISIGEGEQHRLPDMLNKFKEWIISNEMNDEEEPSETREVEAIDIPELDSYSFVRAGLWWSVLARDNWRCCSCGRTAKEDGVTLEVDHIIPRSKGGTDEMSNLQTLCKKCNIGKSNKDTTDLRRSLP